MTTSSGCPERRMLPSTMTSADSGSAFTVRRAGFQRRRTATRPAGSPSAISTSLGKQ